MMKGNNELILNHATMIEALQLWVDSQFLKDWALVQSVEEVTGGQYSQGFRIKLSEVSKEEVK